MTTNSEASFSHRVAGPLGSERLATPWLLVGVVFVGAILMRQLIPLNTDVSWLLVVGERMLDGQHLYRDIIEINPPMAAFAYLPGVALARFLGVDPRHVVDAQLLLLAAVSLVSIWRILLLSSALAEINWRALAVWAAAVLTILPMNVFGQREHIATLTFLPALAVYALRSNRDRAPLWAVLIAGVGVGITLIFKPFFVIPAALCIVSSAIGSRSWRAPFFPGNMTAGCLVVA